MHQIKAHFGELNSLVDTIAHTSSEIERQLDTLTKQLRALTEMWTGASSEGFQRTVNEWYSAADDLQNSLRRLDRILRTTQANYRGALVTNTRMWPKR